MSLNLAPATYEDYRALARKRLPRFLFDYLDGGAGDERTLARNLSDFGAYHFAQSVMNDVSSITTRTRLFGQDASMPVALGPIGLGGMMTRRAETQAKRAADAAGIPYCLSTVSVCAIEEVAAVSDIPFWFQLYMLRDRGAVKSLINRAKAAGVKTLVFTVDLPVVGARYRDIRNGFDGGKSGLGGLWGRLRSGPIDYLLHPKWLFDVGLCGKPHGFGNLIDYVPKARTPADFKSWVDAQFDPSCTWDDIVWLRDLWDGDLVIKGVLSSDDARHAVAAGANGVIVSNHGGRQLDDVPSSISILPEIIAAIDGKATILMDGGVRSGQDVVKAMALGADGVLLGRAYMYALAASGQMGLSDFLGRIGADIELCLALTGQTDISAVNKSILRPSHESGAI